MSSARRRLLGVALAACCALAFAPAVALAVPGIPGDSVQDVSSAAATATPVPHEGRPTNSGKCFVCHSLHGNRAASAKLIRGASEADTCAYCHMNSLTGYTQVYESDMGNYAGTNLDNAHNSFQVAGVEQGVTCTGCHQVHAAPGRMTANGYLSQKLLVGQKKYTGRGYDPVAQEPRSRDDTRTAMSKWCAGCHFTRSGTKSSYWGGEGGGSTHVMTAAAASHGDSRSVVPSRIAWRESSHCSSCHSSEFDSGGGEWPHFTAGVRFLESGADASSSVPATSTKQDGVCLRCHRDGSGKGIGLSF